MAQASAFCVSHFFATKAPVTLWMRWFERSSPRLWPAVGEETAAAICKRRSSAWTAAVPVNEVRRGRRDRAKQLDKLIRGPVQQIGSAVPSERATASAEIIGIQSLEFAMLSRDFGQIEATSTRSTPWYEPQGWDSAFHIL